MLVLQWYRVVLVVAAAAGDIAVVVVVGKTAVVATGYTVASEEQRLGAGDMPAVCWCHTEVEGAAVAGP